MVFFLMSVTIKSHKIRVIYDVESVSKRCNKDAGDFVDQAFPVSICARDVSIALGYSRKKIPLNLVHRDNKKRLSTYGLNVSYREGLLKFIDKDGLEELFSKSKKPKLLTVGLKISELMGTSWNVKMPKHEQFTISRIKTVFEEEDMVDQYVVFTPDQPGNNYRIDLYFETHMIAVECDEHNHSNYDADKEIIRQKYIEKKLNCRFVRYNPDADGFDIFKVIRDIRRMITARGEMMGMTGNLEDKPSTSKAIPMEQSYKVLVLGPFKMKIVREQIYITENDKLRLSN